MQNREFDKLFNEGENIKHMTPNAPNFNKLEQFMNDYNDGNGQKESLQDAKDIIKKSETPMPKELISEIRLFISQQRNQNVKERTIKRMVQRKYKIMVLPK